MEIESSSTIQFAYCFFLNFENPNKVTQSHKKRVVESFLFICVKDIKNV